MSIYDLDQRVLDVRVPRFDLAVVGSKLPADSSSRVQTIKRFFEVHGAEDVEEFSIVPAQVGVIKRRLVGETVRNRTARPVAEQDRRPISKAFLAIPCLEALRTRGSHSDGNESPFTQPEIVVPRCSEISLTFRASARILTWNNTGTTKGPQNGKAVHRIEEPQPGSG